MCYVGVNHSPPWLDPKTYNRTVAETLPLILLYDTLYPEDYLDNANKILILILSTDCKTIIHECTQMWQWSQ